MPDSKKEGQWRRIGGTLELFLGSYFAACGCLAILFFITLENRDGVLVSIVGLLFGLLLIFRAGHLLRWRPWIFRLVAMLLVLGPVIWVTPAFLSASVETSAARHRRALAASIEGRAVKAYELAPVGTINKLSPDLRGNKYAQFGYRWAVTLRDSVQGVTADTFVWCTEKMQSIMHGAEEPSAPPPPQSRRSRPAAAAPPPSSPPPDQPVPQRPQQQ